MRCLATHTEPPKEADIWLQTYLKDDAGLHLARCNLRLARLCAEAQQLFDETASRNEKWILGLLHVVKEAIIIDIEYQNWTNSTSDPWRYKILRAVLQPSSDRRTDTRSPASPTTSTYIYHDIWVAHVWNNYRSSRIHLHEVLLHCIALLQEPKNGEMLSIDPEVTRVESEFIIAEALHDICASVPFCMGEIDSIGNVNGSSCRMPLCGYLLIWPLFVANASAKSGSAEDEWIREKLEYISDVMGIGRARELANRARKEPWDLT